MKKQFTLIAWITLIMTLLLSSCQRFEGDAIQKLAYGKDESGRHFVDLGLSVKWATCNIGAETPEQQGLLYAWGETTPKEEYTWDNYKFGPDTALSKYCAKPDVAWNGFTDAKTTLELSDDAAHVNWRGRWRMPTQAEWNELIENCTWTQTEYMGVKGYDVKASNGNRIFLPAPDENALYASSSLIETRPGEALHLSIFDQYDALTAQYRYRAYSVRAVYGPVLPQYCLVNFDANGGEGIMHPQQFSKGALIPLTEVRFTKQASVFSSWNTKADGSGTSYTDRDVVSLTENITLYAQWTPCYTITFDANGGEGTMDSLTIVSGTKKLLPANTFTRSGYVFAGWNTAPDGSGTAYKESSEIAPTENLTLYAQWTPCYTITFDANGGEGTMDSLQIVQGEETELPSNTFTRNGYVFAGWNTAPDGSGISYKEFSEIEPTQNMTLYAQWTPCYTITFDANGGEGSMKPQTVAMGEEISITSNTFTRSGHSFTAWNTKADGSGTSYVNNQVIILSQDITLYAQWMECKVESAQINASAAGIYEGGSELSTGTVLAETPSIVMSVGADDTYKLTSAVVNDMTRAIVGGASIDLSIACLGSTNPKDADGGNCDANVTAPVSGGFFAFEAKRDGYLYVVCKGVSNRTYLVSEEGTLIGYDFAMYTPNAPWGSILRYTLEGEGEFNQIVKGSKAAANLIWAEKIALGNRWEAAAGGAGKIAASGVAVIKFPVFATCGYTVNACGTKIVSSGFFFVDAETEVVISDDAGNKVVLYETGVSNTNYYNVTFNANGGTGTMSKQRFKEGVSQQLSPNTFTRSGYTFVGWNTAPDGSGTSYTDKQVVSLTEDLTLYAQWKQWIFYSVTFKANGGIGTMADQVFEAGVSQALVSNAFIRSGYTFIGWNTAPDGSGTSYTDRQVVILTEDITLYAQWMEFKVESAQINASAAGIYEGGSELSAGTILAETPSIVMSVGADDTYKLTSAVVNDMTRAIVGGASIDLSIACQGFTNPKDASGGNCDANVTAPAVGAFFVFEAKRDGYLYVLCRGMSNKTYLVSEEGTLIGYDFAMYTPNAPWGSILRYTLEGEGEYNQIVKGSKAAANFIWPEKIVLGDRWESAAGGAGKIAATGGAVIKFPVFAGCRYTVHSNGSKIVSSGYFFGSSEEKVVLDDGSGNEVELF